MFRAAFKKRSDISGPFIEDVRIASADINEDLTGKSTSTVTIHDKLVNVESGDIIGIYNNKGEFIYVGKIDSIETPNELSRSTSNKTKDIKIKVSQFASIFNDNHLVIAQTSTNQKAFFNNKPISYILDFYLQSKEKGQESIVNTMGASPGFVPTYSGLIDADVETSYKGISHEVIDSDATYMPYPLEKDTINLESFIYETFESYNRIIRPFFRRNRNNNLPSGYKELCYIQTTGAQYFDTGIKPSLNINLLRIELDAQLVEKEATDSYDIFIGSGYYNSTSSSRQNLYIGTDKGNFFKMMSTTNSISNNVSVATIDYARHLFVLDQVNKHYTCANHDLTFSTTISKNLTKNLIIGAGYASGSSSCPVSYYSKIRVYDCKIYSSGTLIQHLVPCCRLSDDISGLYDTVTDTFITPTGDPVTKGYTDTAINIAIFNPSGTIQYDELGSWDYSQKILFDSYQSISDLEITKEDIDYNTCCVYSSDGATLRGSYTLLKDGTLQQLTTKTSYPTRFGINKTTYVFDDTNTVATLARAELPTVQADHKIEFVFHFDDKNPFGSFNIGQPILFYVTNESVYDETEQTQTVPYYDTYLTAWSYEIKENSDTINEAEFTLGKVRTSLTSKLNKK